MSEALCRTETAMLPSSRFWQAIRRRARLSVGFRFITAIGCGLFIGAESPLPGTLLPAAADSAGAIKTVRGKVVDESGNPVAGADVWLPLNYETRPEDRRTVHAQSDRQGRFQLLLPQKWLTDRRHTEIYSLAWACAAGRRIGTQSAYQAMAHQGMAAEEDPPEVEIRLGPATDTAFVIIGADGRPLAGAEVEPHLYRTSQAFGVVPPELLPLVGAKTNATGLARLPAVPREGFITVRVTSKALGVQQVQIDGGSSAPAVRTLRLRSVGRVEGRIVAENPRTARGVRVSLSTRDPVALHGANRSKGEAVVFSDDRGQFAVDAIATGKIMLFARVDRSLPVRPELPQNFTVAADQVTKIEVRLLEAVPVRGVIRVRGSGKPIAGAEIRVGYGGGFQSDRVESNEQGEFTTYVLPGDVRVQVFYVPSPFTQSTESRGRMHKVPAGAKQFDLPPIEVFATRTLKGRLIDQNDKPIDDTFITVLKQEKTCGYAMPGKDGTFTIDQLPTDVDLHELTYSVRLPRGNPMEATLVSTDPLLLQVDVGDPAELTTVLKGRVVDTGGQPVAGAEVELHERRTGSDGRFSRRRTVSFGEQQALTTDAEGLFQSPAPVEGGIEYRALVHPGEVAAAGSQWVKAAGKAADFGDLIVRRLRTVEGRVVDADGKPMPGAVVRNWGNDAPQTTSVTDDDGRFSLAGLPPGKVFLTVESPESTFHGECVEPVRRAVYMQSDPKTLGQPLCRAGGPARRPLCDRGAQGYRDHRAGRPPGPPGQPRARD